MAGALGFALGVGMKALSGYAQGQMQKQKQHDDLMLNMAHENPSFGTSDVFQKWAKGRLGPDIAKGYSQTGQMFEQMQQQIAGTSAPAAGRPAGATPGTGTMTSGPPTARLAGDPLMMAAGAPRPSAAATASPAARPSGGVVDDWLSHARTLQAEIDRLEGIRTKYANFGPFARVAPALEKHIADLQQQRTQAEENWRTAQTAARQTPEYKAGVAGAEEKARLAEKYSPEEQKREREAAAARSGAEEEARLRVRGRFAKTGEKFTDLASELRSMAPLERIKAIDALHKDTYPKGDAESRLIPDPANPGHFKLGSAGEAPPSLENFGRSFGIDMKSGEMIGGTPTTAAPKARAAGRPAVAPTINIKGRGRATFAGMSSGGLPTYRLPDGEVVEVNPTALAKVRAK